METQALNQTRLKDILSSLDHSQAIWAIKFLEDVLAGKNSKPITLTTADETEQEVELDVEENKKKHVWWDYPVSPEVMAMTFKHRKSITDNYKQDLYNALEEKYR